MKIANGKCARAEGRGAGGARQKGKRTCCTGTLQEWVESGRERKRECGLAAGEVVVQGLRLKVEQAMEPDLESRAALAALSLCGCRVVVMRV